MNIQGIGSNYHPGMEQAEAMTDEQKQTVDDILSQYDLENLSEEDRMSIRSDLKDADIKPSRELFQTMEAAGMEMPKGGAEGGKGPKGKGGPPPGGKPQQGGQGVDSVFSSEETTSAFMALIEELQSGELEEDDFLSQVEELLTSEDQSIETTQFIDFMV